MNLSMDLSLPAKPIVQTPELYSEATVIYNAIRILAQAFDDLVNEILLVSFEAINVGQIVAIYNDAGVGKARLALDGTYFATGFAANNTIAGQTARIKIRGRYPLFPAATLTPGAKYYLSNAVAGSITAGATTQAIGVAQSDTTLLWIPRI